MSKQNYAANAKLKICMFGQKRIPSREGGVEVVVEELATRMAQQGHSVTCYNRGGHHVSGSAFDAEAVSKYKGVRLKTVPTIDKKGLAAVTSSFFAALCSAFGPYDVVHIHAEGPAAFCWLPKFFGKKSLLPSMVWIGSVKSGRVDLAQNTSIWAKKWPPNGRMKSSF